MSDAMLEPLWLGVLAPGCEARLSDIDLRGNRPPWSEASFAGEFSNQVSTVLGCRFRGEIIGFAVVHYVHPQAHILNVAVAQEFRSLGVGRRLLGFIIETLRGKECETLSLEVRRSNSAAQNLYASIGFEVIAERLRYYPDDGEDALVMRVPIECALKIFKQDNFVDPRKKLLPKQLLSSLLSNTNV